MGKKSRPSIALNSSFLSEAAVLILQLMMPSEPLVLSIFILASPFFL
jgi:hypothetical protein